MKKYILLFVFVAFSYGTSIAQVAKLKAEIKALPDYPLKATTFGELYKYYMTLEDIYYKYSSTETPGNEDEEKSEAQMHAEKLAGEFEGLTREQIIAKGMAMQDKNLTAGKMELKKNMQEYALKHANEMFPKNNDLRARAEALMPELNLIKEPYDKVVYKNIIEIGGGYKNPAEVEEAYKKMMGLLNESLDKYYRVDSLYIKAVLTSENYTNNTYLPFIEALDRVENEYIAAHPLTSKEIDVSSFYREALLLALLTRMKIAEIFYEYYLSKNKINESHSISTKDNLYLLDGSGNRPIHVIHLYKGDSQKR